MCLVIDAAEGKNRASHSDFFGQIQIFWQNYSDFLSLESGRSALKRELKGACVQIKIIVKCIDLEGLSFMLVSVKLSSDSFMYFISVELHTAF